MDIALVGNLGPEHATENDVRKSLLILGHNVFPFQESDPAAHERAMMGTKRYDLCIWLHTHGPGWDTNLWRSVFDCPYVGFTLDLFRGLARHDPAYVRTHPWFTCDYFYQPDEPDWLISQGVKGARFSPPGILETSAYAAAPDPLHPAYGKIIFVGSRTYHPEWPWRQELLAFCEKEYGDRFMVFEHSSGMRGHALNVLYASAAVVVGDSCLASPDSRYTSDRLYETLGRGGNLVYPHIRYEEPYIQGGFHTWVYRPGDTASLKTAIDAALVGIPRWAQGSIPEFINHCTYTARLRKILEEVKP